MEAFILTTGQLALALAGIASCVALLCIIAAMLRWLFRVVRSTVLLGDPTDRPPIGCGLRKW
jgi:hypothetical protein